MIPAAHRGREYIYAVFEVKQGLTRQLIRDAGRKAASVRSLRRTSVPIISAGGPRAAIAPGQILAVSWRCDPRRTNRFRKESPMSY
jgi:hypothetical protein